MGTTSAARRKGTRPVRGVRKGTRPLPGPRLEVGATVPLHRQLYSRIRTLILSGQLAAGSRLPSTRALAASLSVSRNTVLAAVAQLCAEGYLEGRHGSGTYVAKQVPDELLKARGNGAGVPRQTQAPRSLSARGALIAGAVRTPLPALTPGRPERPAFTIGLPDLESFPLAQWTRDLAQCWRRSPRELMRYNDPAGYRPLREAIATRLVTTRGVRCSADEVVIVTGSQQALEFAGRMLLDPGDPVWIEDPGYIGARAALIAAGARVIPVPVDQEGLDVDAGMAREPAARLVFVTPSHQFPLGSTLSLARRLALIEWASRTGAWVLEDDYDSEFRYISRPLTALQGIDTEGRVIYVGTFSKVLFPALRLGYMVAPADLVDALVAAHMSTDIHAHILEQAGLAEFIQAGHLDRHVRRMRVTYAERQAVLVEAVKQQLTGFLDIEPSGSGLHLVGWLRNGLDDRVVSREAAAHGVDVWPLSLHYVNPGPGSAILLGYAGMTPAEIRAGVQTLAMLLPRLVDSESQAQSEAPGSHCRRSL